MTLAKRLRRRTSVDKQLSACDGDYCYYGLGTQQIKFVTFADRDLSTAGTNGHDFGAGFEISDIFATEKEPSVVYAVIEETATNKYKIHRSSNNGATFSFEKRLGDVDGTDGNQLTNVATLEGGTGITLHDFGDGNGLQLYVAEYDSSASQDCKLIKRNNAGTWSDVWDSQGVVDHLHCVRSDPYSSRLYGSTGDTNAKSIVWEWDGVNAWVDGVMPHVAGVIGLNAYGGAQRYRAVDILFDEDHIYYGADAQSNDTDDYGIWRFNKAPLRNPTRVDTQLGDKAGTRLGWSGVSITDATRKVFIADAAAAGVDGGDDCHFIYGKKDKDTFETIGRVNKRVGVGSGAGQFRIGYVKGVIWISYSDPAGRYDAFTGFYEIGEDFCEERPDELAPMFHVASTGSDASATHGGKYDLPFATLDYALTGDRVTYGCAVLLQDDATVSRFTADYDAFPYLTGGNSLAGSTGKPIQICSDSSTKRKVIHDSADTNTNCLNAGHANTTIEFDGVDFDDEKTGSDMVIGPTTVSDAKIIFRDSVLGNVSGVYANLIQYRQYTIWLIRSRLYDSGSPANNWDSTRTGHLKAIATHFSGSSYAIYVRGSGSTVECYNCVFDSTGTYQVERVDSDPDDPIIKNSVFVNAGANSVRYNGSTTNEGGASNNLLDVATTPADNEGAGSVVDANANLYYDQKDAANVPVNSIARSGGEAIPSSFPLPAYGVDKKPFKIIPGIGRYAGNESVTETRDSGVIRRAVRAAVY